MRKTFAVLGAALALSLGAGVAPAVATNIGHEGCTPGYWKNHKNNWEEASPTKLVSSVFNVSSALSTTTFAQALSLQGGKGIAGAERTLIRAAVAAYLNAAHEGVGYPWRRYAEGLDGRPPLVQAVNDALASGDRQTMLALAAQLDADNNLGCPL